MAIQDLGNPTDEQISEYWRTYGEVIQARRDGYHKPYSNEHSDEALWSAYDLGFHDALARPADVCPACGGTGAKDFAGFAMDPCDHVESAAL